MFEKDGLNYYTGQLVINHEKGTASFHLTCTADIESAGDSEILTVSNLPDIINLPIFVEWPKAPDKNWREPLLGVETKLSVMKTQLDIFTVIPREWAQQLMSIALASTRQMLEYEARIVNNSLPENPPANAKYTCPHTVTEKYIDVSAEPSMTRERCVECGMSWGVKG